MKRLPFALAAAICAAPAASPAGEPVESSAYAPFTLVLYNTNSEDSREIAAYYAGQREIPLDNVVGFDAPVAEEISREEYDRTIRAPLRAKFDENEWWRREPDARGVLRPVENKMKFAAIIYGMPLKIKGSPGELTGKRDPETGEALRERVDQRSTDAASVDSELALIGVDLPDYRGPGASTYFRATEAFGKPELLLTSRIDAPTAEIARRLVDDAIATERSGLWGTAVVDVAELAKTKGEGYAVGDRWLENSATFFHKAGIPVITDRSPALLPAGYPLRDGDVSLYFGWYAGRVTGPFADLSFRFKRGAVAVHLHSLSAKSMRPTKRFWTAPLIHRGACASLGNVYEPFLTLTTHFDLFNARLLGGFTLAEAAWMATPAASWMTVVVGDPLYQPFRRGVRYDMEQERSYKAFRLAVRKWGGDPAALVENLDRAATSLDDPQVTEMTGLHLLGAGDHAGAIAKFAAAKAAFAAPADKLRQDLHAARALAESGDTATAVKGLRIAASEFGDSPGARAATALANQLDPPPPPAPAPE